MMPYLPKSMQLRLIRYALSHLDFLDHDTYDIEKDFSLSLGMQNVLEMKNVGIAVERLSQMLALPASIKLLSAKILLLRVQIPADLYRTPIRVEVAGIQAKARLINTPITSHDANFFGQPGRADTEDDNSENFGLPTAEALASSFLAEMPPEADELRTALEASQAELGDSYIGDTEGNEVGMGNPMSLWDFIPNFFRRVVDRLEIEIRSVKATLEGSCFKDVLDTLGTNYTPDTHRPLSDNLLHMEVEVGSLEVEGVTSGNVAREVFSEGERDRARNQRKLGKRLIRLNRLMISLAGHPECFNTDTVLLTASEGGNVETNTTASESTILPPDDINIETSAEGMLESVETISRPTYVSSAASQDSVTPTKFDTRASPVVTMDSADFDKFEEPRKFLISGSQQSSIPEESTRPQQASSLKANSNEEGLLLVFDTEDHQPLPSSPQQTDEYTDQVDEGRTPSITSSQQMDDSFAQFNDQIPSVSQSLLQESIYSEEDRFADIDENKSHRFNASSPRFDAGILDNSISIKSPNNTPFNKEVALDVSEGVYSRNDTTIHSSPGENMEDSLEYSDPGEHYLQTSVISSSSAQEPTSIIAPERSNGLDSPPNEQEKTGELIDLSTTEEPRPPLFSTPPDDEDDDEGEASVYMSYPNSEDDENEDPPSDLTQENLKPMSSETPVNKNDSQGSVVEVAPREKLSTSKSTIHSPGHASPEDVHQNIFNPITTEDSIRHSNDLHAEGELSPSPSDSDSDSDVDGSESSDLQMSAMQQNALSQSMFFTHEEAGSLYMSAISDAPITQGRRSQRGTRHDLDHHFLRDIEEQPASEPNNTERRLLLRKHIIDLDFVEIWVPGLEKPTDLTETDINTAETHQDMSDTMYSTLPGSMPGAFSTYAARRSEELHFSQVPDELPVTKKRTVGFAIDGSSSREKTKRQEGNSQAPSSGKTFDCEVVVGNVQASLDLFLSKFFMEVLDALNSNNQGAISQNPKNYQQNTKQTPQTHSKHAQDEFRLKVDILNINLRLVSQIRGTIEDIDPDSSTILDPEDDKSRSSSANDHDDDNTILLCRINNTEARYTQKISNKDLHSRLNLSLGQFALSDSQFDLLSFLKPSRAGKSPSKTANNGQGPDVKVDITLSPLSERSIHVESLPLRIHLPMQRIEEICERFGGFGSVLSLAVNPSNSAPGSRSLGQQTINKKPVQNTPDLGTGASTKFDANFGGLVIELEVSNGEGLGISTSPIVVLSDSGASLSVEIQQLAIFGPNIQSIGTHRSSSTMVVAEHIWIEIEDQPSPQDLERLISLITPSTDMFEKEDDLMIEVLLSQRRQGSVLRGGIDSIKANIEASDLQQLKYVSNELAKLATFAKYIPQDERPGMLSLIDIKKLVLSLTVGKEVGNIEFVGSNTEICHIGVPSLLAVAVRSLELTRNDEDIIITEALPRAIAAAAIKGASRPMFKLRILGDEPEPVIKVKIWNLRVEYDVEVFLAIAKLPDILSQSSSSVDLSVSQETAASAGSGSSTPKPERSLSLDIAMRNSAVALNPLGSKAKALFILADTRIIGMLAVTEPPKVDLAMKKAFLMLTDDKTALVTPSLNASESARRRGTIDDDISGFSSQGYVSIVTVKSMTAALSFEETDKPDLKTADLEIRDIFVLLESCADSTQTLIGVLNGLKPPVPQGQEIKYMTEVMPIDLLASLDENAFKKMSSQVEQKSNQSTGLDSDDGDLVDDDIPYNSHFIESYYSSQPKSNLQSKDTLAESVLETEELGGLGSRQLSAGEKAMLSSFQEQAQVIDDNPLLFEEDHFRPSTEPPQSQLKKANGKIPGAVVRLRNAQVIWNLHDGYDWERTRNELSKAIHKVEARAIERRTRHESRDIMEEFESDDALETYDVLFNSIYITIPQDRDPKDLSREISAQIKGGGGDDGTSDIASITSQTYSVRSQSQAGSRNTRGHGPGYRYRRSSRGKLQIDLRGVDLDFVIFEPDGQELQNSIDLRVKDFEIIDNIPTSTWRKFATYMKDAGARESGIPMVHLGLNTVRPVPELAATELIIKVNILPLRLHVDQDSLDFLTRFFEFKDSNGPASPVATEEPFIQRCEVNSVRVKLDFKPKRVDYAGLRSGKTTEFMNFFILDEADMVMRHVILVGVSGFERLGKDLNDVWMPDIKRNQLGGVLGGVAPVRSIVNIGTGVRDLVRVPIMEYKKDGRLVRSIQKGALRFAKTTTSEVVRFGAKVAIGTQNMLEKTEEMLGGEGSSQRNSTRHWDPEDDFGEEDSRSAVYSPYAEQPMGLYRGIRDAREGFVRNIGEAREAILKVPNEAAEGGSAQGAAAAVMRAAPTVMIRPMIGVAEAVHKTLHGIDNTIDKQKREKLKDKYKRR